VVLLKKIIYAPQSVLPDQLRMFLTHGILESFFTNSVTLLKGLKYLKRDFSLCDVLRSSSSASKSSKTRKIL